MQLSERFRKTEYKENGDPYSLVELKVIQEVVSLSVFAFFSMLLFRNEPFRWNHLAGFICLILAVYFILKSSLNFLPFLWL